MPILTGRKDEIINLAAKMIGSGKVVAIPTETVYGLGGNIAIDSAIKTIYKLKNRPKNHPLIVHISDIEQLYEYATQIPKYVEFLAHRFWPGPLTFILPKSNKVSSLVTGGQDTVAIRMPNHDLTLSLIRTVGHAIAAPSANKFGNVSPTRPEHVLTEFMDEIDVMDGGICNIGIESTIIDATSQDYYRILRPGPITQNDLDLVLTNSSTKIRLIDKVVRKISVPGTHIRHYSPQTPLIIFNNSNQISSLIKEYHNIYIIHYSNLALHDYNHTYKIIANPLEFAKHLYHALRLGDKSFSKIIAIEAPPNEIKWDAIWDRLRRSANQ